MLHHDEVHVYPIIDTRTNKLITAIVGYETGHDFTANFDDVAAQVAGRTVNEASPTDTDPFAEVIQVTHDEDLADLILFILETLSDSDASPSMHAKAKDDVIWLSCSYSYVDPDVIEDIDDFEDAIYDGEVGVDSINEFSWLPVVDMSVYLNFALDNTNSHNVDSILVTHGIAVITDNSVSSTSDLTLTLLLESAVAHEYM